MVVTIKVNVSSQFSFIIRASSCIYLLGKPEELAAIVNLVVTID